MEDVQPKTIKYVLMDLDGTSVKSEEFWISLIEKTAKELLSDESFCFTAEDIPFVSGFSTVEHLKYCIDKYSIPATIQQANDKYHEIAKRELEEILNGRGNVDAFCPREGLKEFLQLCAKKGVKVGLATSGLDYKAIPEIVATFKSVDLGEPTEFYDAIVTGGRRKQKGEYGTIGEMAVKPHPWVYAELGFALKITDKSSAIVIEDSASGVISARTAGYAVVGFKDGNILKSGLEDFCCYMIDGFEEIKFE